MTFKTLCTFGTAYAKQARTTPQLFLSTNGNARRPNVYQTDKYSFHKQNEEKNDLSSIVSRIHNLGIS